MPLHVFISYAHLEATSEAESLHALLEARGFSCFLDRSRMHLGAVISEALARAASEARCFVPLVTPGYEASAWCRAELDIACARPDALIVPVVWGAVHDLPARLRPRLVVPWSDAESVTAALIESLHPWRDLSLRERCREQLSATLGGIAQYQPALTIPRSQFEEKLEEQLAEHRRATRTPRTVVAVLGPQGVGKTTAICHYLDRHETLAVFALARRPAPLAPDATWTLSPIRLPEDVPEREGADGPLVVVIDGLNEGDSASVEQILRGSTIERILHQGAVLVVTCWPAHWRRRFRLSLPGAETIEVQEFSESELEAALARRGISMEELGPGLRKLCLRPALLDHVARLRERLGGVSDLSKMDVFVADLMFKAEERWLEPGDVLGFRDHLVDLVRAFREQRPVELSQELLGARWSNLQRKLLVLEDLGFIAVDAHHDILRVVKPEATLAAMGLLLCKELSQGRNRVERVEILKGQLEHIGDFVEPGRAALLAVGLALVRGDMDAVEALVIWITDARNADIDALAEYGHQVQGPLALVARELVEESLFDNLGLARSRAESTLVWMLKPEDEPLLRLLLSSDRPPDLALLQTALERMPLPELLEAALDRLDELFEVFGTDDARVTSLLFGLIEGYGERLSRPLLARLDHEVTLQLITELGDPLFTEPLLARAEEAEDPLPWLEALPRIVDPAVNQRLERLLERGEMIVQKEILDWRIWTGSPGLLSALRLGGLELLVEQELRLAASYARWNGEHGDIANWLRQNARSCLEMEREDVVQATREACVLFGLFDVAVELGEITEEELEAARSVPLPSGERAAMLGRLSLATSGLDLWGLAETHPALAAESLADLDEARVAQEHACGLLLPCERVRGLMERETDEPAFALRLACYLEDPSVRALALEQLDSGESVGLDALRAVTCLELLRPLEKRPDVLVEASLMALAHQQGRPRSPEVERLLRAALRVCPPDHPLLSHMGDLRHEGWPELTKLARDPEQPGSLLWRLAGQGPFDARLYKVLMAVHADPTGEDLFRLAPCHPFFQPALALHLERAVSGGVPEEESDKLLFCLCIQAAARQGLRVPRAFLEHIVHEEDIYDVDIAKAVLCAAVRQAPDLVEAALHRLAWPRSGDYLRYLLVDPMLVCPVDARGPLLVALCHDEDPTNLLPRASLLDEDQVFTSLHQRPLTVGEWRYASERVERQWRANLAVLALYLDDPIPALEVLSREPLWVVRYQALKARVRLEEWRELDELLDELEADPDAFLADGPALHLARRLDQRLEPRLRAFMSSPDPRLRRASYWIQESATASPSEGPTWP